MSVSNAGLKTFACSREDHDDCRGSISLGAGGSIGCECRCHDCECGECWEASG